MHYQIWTAIYTLMSFIQDQRHRPAKPVSWMWLLQAQHCPEAQGSPPSKASSSSLSHEEPSQKEPSKLHDVLPQRHLYFRNSGSRVTVGTVRKTPQKSHQSLAQPHREAAQHNLRVPGKEVQCTAGLLRWANGKTSGNFLLQTLQKEVIVHFQNRNHFCNRTGVWKEEQIRKTLLFRAAQSTMFSWNIKLCDSCGKESSIPEKSLKTPD